MYVKRKQKIIIGVSLLVIACLLAAGTYVYIEYYAKKKETPITQSTNTTIDPRISPLCTQGLILEVNRIRDRDIVKVMMKSGNAWKTKPQFYYIAKIDNVEQISKDIQATAGASNEQLFNTWDTMFQENKMSAQVQQEQEKSDVTLSIMERVPVGILGNRYQDEERDKIQVTYDYRTGRWSGSDSFNDSDGYGHYNGTTFEVWFNIYQTDYNHDGIPYWTEVNVYHLDPTVTHVTDDPNHDGIPIPWDWKWGFNPFANDGHAQQDPDHDGLTNLEEYQMRKYYANPYHQDVYLEIDNMQKKNAFDVNHKLYPETPEFMMERYAQHNICLYIDSGWPDSPANGGGQYVPYYQVISQDSGMMLQFYNHYFPDDRKGIFRYAIIANSAGFSHPAVFNMYDCMAISTHYNIVYSLGRKAFNERTKILAQTSEVMHELGHTMGIRHETVPGNDNFSYTEGKAQKQAFIDAWGNYKSVMNYYYFWVYSVVDYSDGSHGAGDNNDWADIHQNMSYFNREAKEIEQPPPITNAVNAFVPRGILYTDIPPLHNLNSLKILSRL